jgi:hypothetical protein
MSIQPSVGRFARIPQNKGERLSGLSKATIYNMGKQHPGLLRKFSAMITVVDVQMLDSILAKCPPLVPRKPRTLRG